MVRTNAWWQDVGNKPYRDGCIGKAGDGYEPGDIDPTRSLIIGDTEPDRLIALDYRVSLAHPSVVLVADEAVRWVKAFNDIESLMKALRLTE